MAHKRDQWRSLVYTSMIFRVPQSTGNLLSTERRSSEDVFHCIILVFKETPGIVPSSDRIHNFLYCKLNILLKTASFVDVTEQQRGHSRRIHKTDSSCSSCRVDQWGGSNVTIYCCSDNAIRYEGGINRLTNY